MLYNRGYMIRISGTHFRQYRVEAHKAASVRF
jgi:hypothetical protein